MACTLLVVSTMHFNSNAILTNDTNYSCDIKVIESFKPGRRPACAWFLRLVSVRMSICVCVCVCLKAINN